MDPPADTILRRVCGTTAPGVGGTRPSALADGEGGRERSETSPSQQPTKRVSAAKTQSERWFVRVDGEENFLRQRCVELGLWNQTRTLHAIFHKGGKGENPHVHFIHTYEKLLQKQTYDLKIKQLFGVVGTSYSTKVWDGEFKGAGSYLYHEEEEGKPAPVFATKGIEQIHIDAMREHAAEWRKIIVEKRPKHQ